MTGEALRPPKLICVLCDLNEGHEELLYPHDCTEVVPLTGCRECFIGHHETCDPRAPWWCACSHPICRDLRMT
jgi:hypothetical protein